MTEKKTPKRTCKNLKLRLNTNTLRGSGRDLWKPVEQAAPLVAVSRPRRANLTKEILWKYQLSNQTIHSPDPLDIKACDDFFEALENEEVEF